MKGDQDMHIKEFPANCGVRIIYGFDDITEAKLSRFVQNNRYRALIGNVSSGQDHPAKIHRLLKKYGFVKMGKSYRCGTTNPSMITWYIHYPLHYPRSWSEILT